MNDADKRQLSASLEDYLETIYWILRDKQAVRAKDIGKRLNVSRSSVTGALHLLAERELINYTPYDVITLTDQGRAIARDVARRHETLRNFFIKVLAVEERDADEAACKMEHAISEVILDRFVNFVDFVERCPRGGTKWIEGFGYYCDNGRQLGDCQKCVRLILDDVHNQDAPLKLKRPSAGRAARAGLRAASKRESGSASRRAKSR